MSSVPSLAATVHAGLQQAIGVALPDAPDCDPQLRRSDRADFQANGLLATAKALKANPRALADRVAAQLSAARPAGLGVLAAWEVSGPGFLNLTLTDAALLAQVEARLADDRLGIGPLPGTGVTVLDYSQPNIAKEMHVGHLRSTVIGDALARILSFGGEQVVRRNHLGDWGTQFGMLIQYRDEFGQSGDDVSSLDALYKTSRAHFDADPDFAERARRRVVDLQAGDPATVASWQRIVDESKRYFATVYQRLDVLLEDADAVGESHYNPQLASICAELEESGVAVRSQGALCVFFDGILNPDGEPVPLIVQKSDGGYGYATTDLAAIRERVADLGADRLLYVVDARQALHFRMVFDTARRAGWLPPEVTAAHVPFGMVLGTDGRPFKTRSGDTVRLVELLDEAVERASAVIAEKNPELAPEQLAERAAQVGIGALKYADLSNARTRDYAFDIARMVSLTGDTGVYLQYAHARIHSILRKAPADSIGRAHPEVALLPAERALALLLDECEAALAAVAESREPHRLCTYLYQLAVSFSAFYEQAPVLKAPDTATRENRLLLCRLTARTLALGLGLLGMAAPEQL
ncbi:arginyl-tRNA synthetase [Kitasatospora sp. MAP12-15]|uniref:arginine--tRNA ligase n=1 Tax=unclassified Kitasatospora TaxID=2633591 RepID=UPI00247662A9|nr:arginine--tRNA ligase [Kitasatospora sp. MAP12-44]MDH6113951.1 arginyl-tRNA synthetase [Kitasatospora sp. MAP12-44]